MIDARTEELINLAIDDVISNDERHELDIMLSASSEAREYEAALRDLDINLKALTEQDYPDTLHNDIMAAVSNSETIKQSSPAKGNVRFLHAPSWPAVIRYGLAASLGLAFAVIVYEARDISGPAGYEQMTGTIAPGRRTQSDTPYSFTISEDGLASQVTLASNPEILVLDVDIDSNETVELIIEPGNEWQFDELAFAVNEPDDFSIVGKKIQIHSTGHQRFAVILLPANDMTRAEYSQIKFDYVRNGTPVQQRALSVRAL